MKMGIDWESEKWGSFVSNHLFPSWAITRTLRRQVGCSRTAFCTLGEFDENGCLRVIGRVNDVIKFKGHLLSPTTIEEKIRQLTGISLVRVFGIEDSIRGQLPAAAILRERSDLKEVTVHQFVKENLPEVNWLLADSFWEDYPEEGRGGGK